MHGPLSALPSVSVVLPTYQRREYLPRVILPLLDDAATCEIVAVVDGSTDGSFELLERLAKDDARICPVLIDNRGESGARLEGVRRAQGDIVLLLDDDVVAEPGLVTAHAQRHAGRDDLLVVGYMPVTDPHTAPERLYSEAYEAHVARWQSGQSVIGTLWAGNLSLRRDAYLRISSLPAPTRYDFHADRVFGLHCSAIGLIGVFDPNCGAQHHYARSLAGLARDAHRQGIALIQMQSEFPDSARPVSRDEFTAYLPTRLAAFVELARRPRFCELARAAARVATHAADVCRLDAAVRGADLLAILERQRGAIEASRTSMTGSP